GRSRSNPRNTSFPRRQPTDVMLKTSANSLMELVQRHIQPMNIRLASPIPALFRLYQRSRRFSDKDDVDEATYIKWPDLLFCCLPESYRVRLWRKITGSRNLDNKDGDARENAEPVEMES
ncbi:unnamed protein product, partial [Owenia fusiformis]